MWYFISGFILGGFAGLILFCILSAGKEPEQEERLKAYKQGYRDALKKVRGLR